MNRVELYNMYQDEKAIIETLDDPFPSFKQWQDNWNKDYITTDDRTNKEQYDSSFSDLILEDVPTKKVEVKTPTKPKVKKKAKSGSKAEKALDIYKSMMDGDTHPIRKDVIQKFIDDLDMSKAGASTYHYNTKAKISKQ